MKKKIIGILVMTLLIATALSSIGTTTVQTTSLMGEVKDQYQEQCDECEYFENYAWQQFVPTMEELIRVEVNIAEQGGEMDITLSIEKPLSTVLTSKTLPASSIPYDCDWVSFDVPDETLTPGSAYYIVLSYDVGGEYAWCGAWEDPYPQGDSTGGEDWDFCFRTFCEEGDNSPPYNPETPSGPITLFVGDLGTYTTSATDPDNDQVQYRFDWDADGPGDVSSWTSLGPSGHAGSLSHSWSSAGTYLVVAKARDEHGLESGWSEGLIVTVELDYAELEAIVGFYGPLAYGSAYQDMPTEIGKIYNIEKIDDNDDLCTALYANVDDSKFSLLQQDEDVKYVQRNYFGNMDVDPNDPGWNFQYGPRNIFVPDAWDITQGSSNVIVAVIDTGIDLSHPDLGNYIGGYDWIDDDTIPNDEYGHGTHCAGIIGAVGNNTIGMAGMNWQVSLLVEKVLDDKGNAPTGQREWICAKGMTHAVNNGADILSMSLGYPDDKGYIQSAVQYVINQDRLLVTSSGNDEDLIDRYPEKCPDDGPIVVGATNILNERTDEDDWGPGDGSSFGPELDLVAPGDLIYSTMPLYHVTMNDVGWGEFDNDYDNMSGTSMACPHVAGVAALMLARNPDLSSNEIECILEATAQDQVGDLTEDTAGWDQFYGHGLVDANAAVTAASTGFSIEITSSNSGEITPPGSAEFTVEVKSLHGAGGNIVLKLDDDHYDISPLTYSFDQNNKPAPFTSKLTITATGSNSFYPKVTRVIGTAETVGCDLVRFSDKFISISSDPLPTDDVVWIKTSPQDDGDTDPNRKGTLHTSPWINCDHDPPQHGKNTLSITVGKLGDIDVDSGPIMVQPYFNEFPWTIPMKEWSHLEKRTINIPAGQDTETEDWEWEIPPGWGEHVCVFAQAWRVGTEEDEDLEFYIQKNNNIAQRNFFNVGTSSPYTTTLTFENPTAKQMNMKIYAEVPNTDWAVDLCHPAKMENGKVVTPMVIPSYSEKEVTLTIIPDEEYESGDVTISYDIEGYEEIYSDMFIFTFRVNPEDNYPPYQPMITGPTSGKAGVQYPYTLVTNDPEGEDISYYFNWGDGSNSGWTDFHDSGAAVTETHTWSSQGKYTLRAKAKDTNGYESDWAELSVSMPRNRAIPTPFLKFLEQYPILYQLLQRFLRL